MKPKQVDPKDLAFHFEGRLNSFVRSKTGVFLRLELDPVDVPSELSEATVNQRWLCVLTPMPDDLPQPSQREIEDGDKAVQFAGIICKDPDFRRWFRVASEEEAVAKLRNKLDVTSRRELHTNAAARRRLYDLYAKFFETQEPSTL